MEDDPNGNNFNSINEMGCIIREGAGGKTVIVHRGMWLQGDRVASHRGDFPACTTTRRGELEHTHKTAMFCKRRKTMSSESCSAFQ